MDGILKEVAAVPARRRDDGDIDVAIASCLAAGDRAEEHDRMHTFVDDSLDGRGE